MTERESLFAVRFRDSWDWLSWTAYPEWNDVFLIVTVKL